MELTTLFVTAFIVGLSGAMMPGPVTAVLVENVFRRGFTAAPLVTLGHALPEMIMVILLAVGLGQLMAEEFWAGIIGVTGAAVLAWMGYGMIKNALSGALTLQGAAAGNKRKHNPFWGGMLVTVINPYWFLWWATIGTSYVLLSQEHGTRGIVLFFSGHILSDLLWLSLIAAALVSGKKYINDKIYAVIMIILGVFLLLLSGYFFWAGINFLR